MSKIFSLSFLLLFIIPSLLISQPKLNLVGGTTFDFGELYTGKAQKTLTIRNEGTDTLLITNVSSSCGCTGTLMSNDHIAPGDSGALLITFDTKRAQTGEVKKAVTLDSNDPNNKKVRIIFAANIIPILDVDPDYVYFQGKAGSPLTQELTIKNPSPNPLKLLSIISSLDNLSLKVEDMNMAPAAEMKMICVLTPKNAGLVKGVITIKTDNPKLPVVEIQVHGLVTAEKSTVKAEKN